MRLSALITKVENSVLRGTKAAAQYSRDLSHAISTEMAANKLANAEALRLKLPERGFVESLEIAARADELVEQRINNDRAAQVRRLRRALAGRVLRGASPLEITTRADEIARVIQQLNNDEVAQLSREYQL